MTTPTDREKTVTIPADEVATVRDFERFLRRQGFSRRAAKSIAVNGFRPVKPKEPPEQAV
nr:hypothetical protein 8 [Rhodospirillaceae bacterium]